MSPVSKADLLSSARIQVLLSGSLIANPHFPCLKLGQKHYFTCPATLSYGNITAKNCRIELSKEYSPEAKAPGDLFNLLIALISPEEELSYKVVAVLFDSVDLTCFSPRTASKMDTTRVFHTQLF